MGDRQGVGKEMGGRAGDWGGGGRPRKWGGGKERAGGIWEVMGEMGRTKQNGVDHGDTL